VEGPSRRLLRASLLDDEPASRALLIHRADGHGGGTWAFELGQGAPLDDEEAGNRFADPVFRAGEYVSIRVADGELMTFRVVAVV